LWIRGLFAKEIPALDDEFAKDQGECSSLGELRERVRRALEAEAAREAEERFQSAILERLAAIHDFEVPDGLVVPEVNAFVERIRRDWELDPLTAVSPLAEREALLARLREGAEQGARARARALLVLDAIAAQEGIEVEESEVSREIERELATAGAEGRELPHRMQGPQLRAAALQRLRRRRALELVARAAQVVERELASSNVAGVGQTR